MTTQSSVTRAVLDIKRIGTRQASSESMLQIEIVRVLPVQVYP